MAIEANNDNDTYYLQKRMEKFPLIQNEQSTNQMNDSFHGSRSKGQIRQISLI